MTKVTKVNHPIISSYLEDFAKNYGISKNKAKDEHALFEKFINDLILKVYGNDVNANFESMETGTAFGIDGVAIFVNDRLIESEEDFDYICKNAKKIDVNFIFTQAKVSKNFDRTQIQDFFMGVLRFFNLEKCEIKELKDQWEISKYIYSKSNKFKELPSIDLYFATLSTNDLDLKDLHMKSTLDKGNYDLINKVMFNDQRINFKPLGLKKIMELYRKLDSNLEIKFNLDKQPVPYPIDPTKKVSSGYYGLIRLESLFDILTDKIDGEIKLKKGIFEDNIRDYLGSDDNIDVNSNMTKEITGSKAHLFGLLNNGITIIADDVSIVTTEATLTNYQIVNGCQTSNVLFESKENITAENIYIPIRLIGTTDEETKHAIIKATNSQTSLKPEQLAALKVEQKDIEEYYKVKRSRNRFDLYYERRTEQYRNEEIQKIKIINIPFQIKATSAMFLDLPHEVSGQYGKVEKSTRGKLFLNSDYLNVYYVSGLAWYRVDAFIRNTEEGKIFRRARWHIMMLFKYFIEPRYLDYSDLEINKEAESVSNKMEKILLDDIESSKLIEQAVNTIKDYLAENGISNISEDRKLFERKETTDGLKSFLVKLYDGVKQ
ncbi:AIPR family protein [Cytobacillus kochii]|uniref:AIPR family protein n=1 Tax=Cytobacillus kochii TaxID=859143 RepID=UPI002E1AEEC1|nr:AIPR family protein [Cytobacillus kochii]